MDTQEYDELAIAAEVTYDSGADGNYMSEANRAKLGLPIFRESTKRAKVANGEARKGKHVTALSFIKLSKKAAEADTFDKFKTSLMSVGKMADDGNVSVFTKEGVKIYKKEDVLITCKGKPILVGRRDEQGRYKIPLMQQQGQWKPKIPTKASKKYLQQANSVYNLPSTEETVKWMHATCDYPVKSTRLTSIKAGNFT